MVALYVVVARVYAQERHPAIFAAFAAAWVVPSSWIGPTVVAVVTDLWSWHWVFLGVVVLSLAVLLMVVPALRGLSRGGDASAPWAFGRLGWSVLAAVAVLALNLVGDAPGIGPVLAVGAVVVALVAVRSLVPCGTLSARRGLPSVILVRLWDSWRVPSRHAGVHAVPADRSVRAHADPRRTRSDRRCPAWGLLHRRCRN